MAKLHGFSALVDYKATHALEFCVVSIVRDRKSRTGCSARRSHLACLLSAEVACEHCEHSEHAAKKFMRK
jgi:hypothetical protein